MLYRQNIYVKICNFYIFQVTTNVGSEYLLQTDSQSTAKKWYDGVRKAIDSSVRTHFLPQAKKIA